MVVNTFSQCFGALTYTPVLLISVYLQRAAMMSSVPACCVYSGGLCAVCTVQPMVPWGSSVTCMPVCDVDPLLISSLTTAASALSCGPLHGRGIDNLLDLCVSPGCRCRIMLPSAQRARAWGGRKCSQISQIVVFTWEIA